MLWIHDMGMASPLGHLVQACAALRAGLASPSAAPDVELMFPGDDAPGPLHVNALPGATYGFDGAGRLAALLAEALADLGARVDLSRLEPDTGLFVAMPDPGARGAYLPVPEGAGPADVQAELARRLVTPAAEAVRAPGLAQLPRVGVGGGHAAFARALGAAAEALSARALRAALVCAVDSLVGASTLRALLEDGRVKTDENPTGFVPGEAAVAMLVSPRPSSSGPAIGVGPPVVAVDGSAPDSPSDGRTLAACVRQAAADGAAPVLVLDHDGEAWRAAEYGMLRHRLVEARHAAADAPAWFPAIGLGNTGAASGAVGTCVAARALTRGYAPAPSFVVASSTEPERMRAAFLVTGGGTAWA